MPADVAQAGGVGWGFISKVVGFHIRYMYYICIIPFSSYYVVDPGIILYYVVDGNTVLSCVPYACVCISTPSCIFNAGCCIMWRIHSVLRTYYLYYKRRQSDNPVQVSETTLKCLKPP